MEQEDVGKVMKLLVTCRKAFPSSRADAETLALYVKVLAPLSYAEIEAAVLRIMRTAHFFPTAAEIFEAAEKIEQAVNKTGLPDAGEAWREAMANVYENHVYIPGRIPAMRCGRLSGASARRSSARWASMRSIRPEPNL